MVKTLAIYLGTAAILLGVMFTFFPLGSDAGAACGNAWSNGDDVEVLDAQVVTDACSAVRAERWVLISSFLVLGAAALFAGLEGGRLPSAGRAADAESPAEPPR